ncbi:MAG TPA: TIM barrel protein, partial [Vicinamibacterales bacterium]
MTPRPLTRRDFLRTSACATAALGLAGRGTASAAEPLYKISLAEWSINRPLFSGKMQHLDFAKIAKSVGIDAIEYVNQFFKDKAKDKAYLREMNTRAQGEGVTQVLIMCDGEGNLGDPDPARRQTAVENHYKWVEAAKFLGCHTVR